MFQPPVEAVFQAQVIALKKDVLMTLMDILQIVAGALLAYYFVCHWVMAQRVA